VLVLSQLDDQFTLTFQRNMLPASSLQDDGIYGFSGHWEEDMYIYMYIFG
jgi:hypothetical protein